MLKTTTQHSAPLPTMSAGDSARRWLGKLVASAAIAIALGGCAVVTVASTAASLVLGTVGLAADATIGAARVAGKAVGAAATAITPSSD